MSRALAAAVITTGCALMVGCGDGSAAPPMSITVFAAASLNGTFTELGDAFAAAHPGATVRFSFGPSSVSRRRSWREHRPMYSPPLVTPRWALS